MKAIYILLMTSILSPASFAKDKLIYSVSLADLESSYTLESELSEDELEILNEGKISDGRRIVGGLLGTTMGLGIGHMVNGQWDETGWIFTTGEIAASALLLAGYIQMLGAALCENCDANESNRQGNRGAMMATVGGLSMAGLRLWEIYDVWARPIRHNDKVDELRSRVTPKVSFGIVPTNEGVGATLALNF